MVDWRTWHREYDDPGSRLARRRAAVQAFIRAALDRSPPGPIRVISMCAGDGGDLLGVLSGHPRCADVEACLVELDPVLSERARPQAPPGVELRCADASTSDAYRGAVPADLVLICGVFGNVVDADVRSTLRALPTLCAKQATVIWTRHRRAPDLTPAIRTWFGEVGFEELGYEGCEETLYGVGSHRFEGEPQPWVAGTRLFQFVR